ncbi:phosphoesterase [archaeon]|nr:phosphoesterase [archaeon]|tara:strand:+ start:409 stop:1110 length:702 start_codon:yes stop_codon:yes gene_type:complete
MEITKGIEIVDLGLFLKDEKILVISDLHIGMEEAYNKQGILIPRFQFPEILKHLDKIFTKVKPKKTVINGDLKHEFGTISSQEWKNTLKLIDYLLEKKQKVILIKGNHDTILEPIVKKRDIKVKDFYNIKDITITHGHKILQDKDLKKVIIIGNEHPAISFESRKTDKYKCFLLGKYKKSKLIVLPSFNFVTIGSDLTKENILSPYLKQNLKNFEVFIAEDKTYKFGKLKDIK